MGIDNVFAEVAEFIISADFEIVNKDLSRPWGGFYVINEKQADAFITKFFSMGNFEKINSSGKISPKILMVAPGKRLSWQYHFRRAEIWKCISGTVGVVTSHSDDEGKQIILGKGDYIQLQQGERHRLVGLDTWGVVAEIWQHTDVNNPSNEDDIVRLQDDFGR